MDNGKNIKQIPINILFANLIQFYLHAITKCIFSSEYNFIMLAYFLLVEIDVAFYGI